ncbi:unnamed protein product (macronuclear) [Paramecium tetraurelia]|uniref:Protein kinase domain-containing protein n=1 Tax=Paramecium tetraurelia TaxID=5888 RepID=A0D616_PARTE|nr:uncharacterized protein GSPATT00013913001 [Paramecium tetraurelia]CAK78483.1 unnamed protein product [Paramecium tetraurelia]|eukprot:XP_001445880.1 hypothetical protein (macronuclear) [Paramecium tetraurelia strain d4-2]
MKQINYSIFDKCPTRNTTLWKKGAPKILQIDRELRQTSKEAPILIRDEMDNLISRNCYHMINSYFISNNCYININNLRLKSVIYKNVEGLQISGKQECLQIFGNPDVISTWKNYLSKYTVQRNFYKKYQVLKMIGKGSHAKVYKIERIKDSSIFAVKIFKSEKLISKDKGIDSILKEIDIMRKLDNKNVLQLHEIFEDENNVYLIVDYLQGGELLKQIENSLDGYTEHLVQNLMYNLLTSLNYLHSKQILHRDIKPENLILRSKDCLTDLVIADFGLSDIYNEQGVYLFQRCGTVGYVAPEVLRDEFYDYKVDMFSVGVILFILLTGEMPFESNSDTDDLLRQNAQCKIDFNKLNQKSISPAAQDLVRLLLDENLNIRPNAQQALLHDWFATPKTDTMVSLSLSKLPIFQIRLDQDDFIKSSTPLWNQKGSPLSEQSPLLPENSSEPEDETNYFKQFISTGQDQYEIGEDCINEEKSPSEMVPKYRLLVKQRSLK